MSRETIHAALVQRLAGAFPDYWVTRDFIRGFDVAEKNWPALIVNATGERDEVDDTSTAPVRRYLEALLVMCLRRADPTQPFEPAINDAVDAVHDALAPKAGERSLGASAHTTLGNLVERACVDGNIEIAREIGDQRALVLIPIEVLTY